MTEYRGRIAPSPTGFLHVGHAATFDVAQARAHAARGKLILRVEDIDVARCRRTFREALIEDLRWFGFAWDEGPDKGGPHVPYVQSERTECYRRALERLQRRGLIYRCFCSRKDVLGAAVAPHDENEEPVYPGTCRNIGSAMVAAGASSTGSEIHAADSYNWRFRVPDGERVTFMDERLGSRTAVAGHDFGDFIVWRRDDVPAYQLAVVVDDAAMQVTEVVRGEDLLTSTFRQLLLYRALDLQPPGFFHAPLIRDQSGNRLAKRDAALSLRALRERGVTPEEIRAQLL